ncbi:hypothetical protein FXW78_46380 [Rhodococcus opacus]|nr:hypothetical protein [Rhodococcus opacus]
MLFSQGGRFGGHALYLKDNRLHYVYNFLGSEQQKISATEDLPTGQNLILAASFDKDGEDPPGTAQGMLSLYYGTARSARAGSEPSPASSASPAPASPPDAAAPKPSPTTTRHHTLGVVRRHPEPGRHRRQRRTLRRPRT